MKDYTEAQNETRVLYVLSNSVWDASDYLNDCNTNPRYTEHYVFATKEEAEEQAQNVATASDIYNDGMLFAMELTDAEILDISGDDDINDFNEALSEDNHEAMEDVAKYIVENADEYDPVVCANYDFDQTLDGAILVFWSWQRYTGYARKLIDVRFAYYDETEAMLAKEDQVFATQCDVLLTADEVKNAGEDLREAVRQELEDKRDWRWQNPSFIETLIEQF